MNRFIDFIHRRVPLRRRDPRKMTMLPHPLAVCAAGVRSALCLWLFSAPAWLIAETPSITFQPFNQTKVVGQNASFAVNATGTAPLTYQWHREGVPIGEATNSFFGLLLTQTNLAGNYTVVVSNSSGSITSAPSVLTIIAAIPGKVSGWGRNDFGDRDVPAEAKSGVTAISAGWLYVTALKNGSVMAWGANTQATNVPAGLSDVAAIAAGGYHALALKNDGTVVAWGDNTYGQTNVPAGLSNVTAIAAGRYHNLALRNDGKVVAWGAGMVNTEMGEDLGQSMVPADLNSVTAIAVGEKHSVALTYNGTVAAWGYNYYGQVTGLEPEHDGEKIPEGAPTHFTDIALPVTLASQGILTNVTAIATGGYHTLALRHDGTVVAWGPTNIVFNSDVYSRQALVPPGLSNVTAIAGGRFYSAVLKKDGSVTAWGFNDSGSMNGGGGNGDVADPVTIGLVVNWAVAVAAGVDYTAVILTLPGIASQPVSQTRMVGRNASFSVAVTNALQLSYRWLKDGITINGVIGSSYNLTLSQTNQTASYTVVVSGYSGSVTSSPPAILTVTPPLPGTVVAWGNNDFGQTNVPLAAQSGVTVVAGGNNHTLALKKDGSVIAWGYNHDGQASVPVVAQSGVVAIAAGIDHSIALKGTGEVLVWGYSSYQITAVPPAAQSGVMAIAGGGYHTIALKTDGTVVTWGRGNEGETTPPNAARSGVMAIAAGAFHSVALKTDGSVVAWGSNNQGQTTVPPAAQNNVVAIAAGYFHTVALKSDGSVVAWGDEGFDYGQTTVPTAAQSGVVAIAAGQLHTVALKEDGTIVTWGDNTDGQTTVPVAAQSGVLSIAAGVAHTLAIIGPPPPTPPSLTRLPVSQTGTIGGRNASFSVTAASTEPLSYQWRRNGIDVSGATSSTYNLLLTQTSQTGSYTVVVSNSGGSVTSSPPAVLTVNVAVPGSVIAWGDNFYGQTNPPVLVQSGVTAIGGGEGFIVALKTDGSVVAWGASGNGQTNVPVEAQSGVSAISPGELHCVALKNDGTVVAWGNNLHGEATVPAGLDGVVAVAAGGAHSVALKSDGTVVTWGAGLVNGTNPNFGQSIVPDGLSDVTAIAAGGLHTLALKNDGSVVAWGAGTLKTGGFPKFGQAIVPTAAQSGVVAIRAGYYHSVALKGDGSVVAWGDNSSGQTAVPAGLTGVIQIAAGFAHNLALKNDGTLAAWGYNEFGQVAEVPNKVDPFDGFSNPVTLGGQVLSGVLAAGGGYGFTVAIVAGTSPPMGPRITTLRSGNNLMLRWPDVSTGYRVQSTLVLSPPILWSDESGTMDTSGGFISIGTPVSGGQKFFRLIKP